MSIGSETNKPKPSPPKKSRQFACISYLTEEQINYCLQHKRELISHWAYILHNKDVKEDGTPKEEHYHILVWTNTPTNINTIRRWFKIEGLDTNTLAQTVISSDDVVDYITHDGSPDKHQYSETDIVSDDWEWFKTRADESPSFQCLNDLIQGTSLLELSKKYGREFIINYAKYNDLAQAIISQEKALQTQRDLDELSKGAEVVKYIGNPNNPNYMPKHYL